MVGLYSEYRRKTGKKTMGFIDKIFKRNKDQKNIHIQFNSNVKQGASQDENVIKLLELKTLIDSLVGSCKYIAKSDYMELMKPYASVGNFFDILEQSGMINAFCVRNGITTSEAKEIIDAYRNVEHLVEQHNEKYIYLNL